MNTLGQEASPYLQQHANNPVNWVPYGKTALERAKKEKKLIFMSIGYSSCHWCHVMARESFEDEEVAEYLNKHFISIKVDREERPGLDKVMQELYQLTNQRGGGWPLSVWMTPDAKPIFLGTYFPNKPRHGLPSFHQLNQRIVELWKNQREDVISQAENISKGISMIENQLIGKSDDIDQEIHDQSVSSLMRRADRKYGGIGSAPKFPRVSSLAYLLSEGVRSKNQEIIDFVEFSFIQMIRGGIFDQLDGGFARYSVDVKWLTPHFEKMLYDNGALLRLGADIFAVTKNKEIEKSLYRTIDWLVKEMLMKNGGFAASMNAESEGEEGKYYLWTIEEVRDVVDKEYLDQVCKYFGITEKGNFKDPHNPEKEGLNILSICEPEIENEGIQKAREQMRAYRDKRVKPDLDDKIITSWNAIAVTGLLNVYEKTGDLRSFELAKTAIDILRSHIKEGYILRYSKMGEERQIQGILDDYAFTIEAFIKFFECTGDLEILKDVELLCNMVIQKFYDPPALYLLPENHIDAINGRPIQVTDDSMASALSVMVKNFYKVSKYIGSTEMHEIGEQILRSTIENTIRFPGSASELLISARYYSDYPYEIVYLGNGRIGQEFQKYFLPSKLVYRTVDPENMGWEVLEGRKLIGDETLYICRNQTCSLPITEYSQESLDSLFTMN